MGNYIACNPNPLASFGSQVIFGGWVDEVLVFVILVEMFKVTVVAVEGFWVEIVWKQQMLKQLPCPGHDMQASFPKLNEDIVVVGTGNKGDVGQKSIVIDDS